MLYNCLNKCILLFTCSTIKAWNKDVHTSQVIVKLGKLRFSGEAADWKISKNIIVRVQVLLSEYLEEEVNEHMQQSN